MTRPKTTAAFAATIAATVAVLTGCSGGGAAAPQEASFDQEITGTLSAWGFDNADDVGTSRLDYAASQLDGVTVDLDATAFDAQKFTTRAASGQVPDVVQMDRQFVATYAAQGLIVPLDDCYSQQDVDPDDRYYESVVDDVDWNDHIWAVPQFYQPPAIILDKRVMDAAGVTSDQIDTSNPDVLLPAIEAMYQASGGNPALLGFDPVGVNAAGLWMLGFGGQLVDDDGVPALDSQENADAIDFLKQIYDAQGGYAKVRSFTDSFDVFGEGNQYAVDQVGSQVQPQWYVNVLSPYVDDVQIEAVPFRDRDGDPFTVASGTAFVIPAGAENPSAACAWALDLTSTDAWMAAGEARAQTLTETPGSINTGLFTGSPEADEAVRSQFVTETGNAGFDQTISTFYDIVGEGQSFGASPAGEAIQTELKNAVTSALLGDKSSADALSDAQDAAMRAYDQTAG